MQIVVHDAARLAVEAVLIVDARQAVVHRAEVLQVEVLLVLRAVADEKVHADIHARAVVERVAADLQRPRALLLPVLLQPDRSLRARERILLEPVLEDDLELCQAVRDIEDAERLAVRIDAVALPVKPDDTRRQVLHGHAQRLLKHLPVKSLLQHRVTPVLLHAPAPLYANQLHDTGKRRAVREQKLDGARRDEVEIAVLDLRLVQLHARLERAQTRAVAAAVRAAPDRITALATVHARMVRPDRKRMAFLRVDEPHHIILLREPRHLCLHFAFRELQRHVVIPPKLQATAGSRSRILFFRHVPAPEPR